MSAQACLAALCSTPDGLGSAEARERRQRVGANALPEARRPGPALLFLRQFASPLIYLLLAAALVSIAIGARLDAGFILAVLTLNALIGAVQEGRADSSARALRALVPRTARVRRDNLVQDIASIDLVPGDIVELESGVRVTADMRLIASTGLSTDESTLTGESLPVCKDADARIPAEMVLAERSTMVHAGCVISQGRGIGIVVATGVDTALGRIGRTLDIAARTGAPPPLVQRLTVLTRQIAVVTIGLIALLALLLWIEGEPTRDIFLLAVALAVSAIPEGLPVAVTVALAAAAQRMARRNAIVRALPAVEGLGACTLIASDKTGTLTINRLSVERVIAADGGLFAPANWLVPTRPPALDAIAFAVAMCNEAQYSRAGCPTGDAVDVALLDFARAAGIDVEKAHARQRDATIPYEPALRYAATAVEGRDLFVKGAAETVLPMCRDPSHEAVARAEALARDGYRVLAIARGPVGNADGDGIADLRLLGFVALVDPLRPEVPAAIARCAAAGIEVRMVTGDHPETARAIAQQLGLRCAPHEVLTGAELTRLEAEPERRFERIASAQVFARIEPAQKLVIVQALRSAGAIVAVTGDGVNDAPALKAADIGIAMGLAGTDVARDAADMILADDNFATIVAGVEEGRITFANIHKIVMFVLATGLAEIGMFLGALLVGLPMPLTPVQLLWLNVVTNGVQDVALGFGGGEGDELARPPRGRLAPLVDRDALILMIPAAVMMAGFALSLMTDVLATGASLDQARNVVLLLTVLFQNAYALCIRHVRHPLWHWSATENRWLFLGIAGALVLHIGAMNLGPTQEILGIAPISAKTLGQCLLGALTIVAAVEASKWGYRWLGRSRRHAQHGPLRIGNIT